MPPVFKLLTDPNCYHKDDDVATSKQNAICLHKFLAKTENTPEVPSVHLLSDLIQQVVVYLYVNFLKCPSPIHYIRSSAPARTSNLGRAQFLCSPEFLTSTCGKSNISCVADMNL